MTPVLWVHEDMLSPLNDAFLRHPGAPALFVFDDEFLTENRWSLKRIVFLYECLLEMPVEIARGNPVEQLRLFAEKHQAIEIVTVDSPGARFREIAARLPQLQSIPEEPFIALREPVDLKRFSRYWRRAEASLLR